MRLNRDQLNALKKKYQVDRIWSFSRVSTFLQCAWEYKMKYIDKIRVPSDNVYTDFGTISHDLIQGLYEHKYDEKEMYEKWKDFVKKWEEDPLSNQFDTEKIRSGYLNNMDCYFKNPRAVNEKIINEKPVLSILQGKERQYVFVGYIDSEYTNNDNILTLVDYKTSSKSGFSPKGLKKKSMQLLLYAIGEHQQKGISYDNIQCRFNMMKYCVVHFQQENGRWKTSVQERSQWVYKMNNKLKTKLPKIGINPIEVDELIIQASQDNNMNCMPKEIQEQFYISNYYIELDVSEKTCRELEKKLTGYCDDIMAFEKLDDQETELEINHPYNPNDYYCKKLCAYHTSREFKEQEGIIEKDVLDSVDAGENIFADAEEDSDEDLIKALLG